MFGWFKRLLSGLDRSTDKPKSNPFAPPAASAGSLSLPEEVWLAYLRTVPQDSLSERVDVAFVPSVVAQARYGEIRRYSALQQDCVRDRGMVLDRHVFVWWEGNAIFAAEGHGLTPDERWVTNGEPREIHWGEVVVIDNMKHFNARVRLRLFKSGTDAEQWLREMVEEMRTHFPEDNKRLLGRDIYIPLV